MMNAIGEVDLHAYADAGGGKMLQNGELMGAEMDRCHRIEVVYTSQKAAVR